MRAIRLFTSLVFVACFLAPVQSNATLVIDITGVPGAGEVTWTFSGSAVASSSDTDLFGGGQDFFNIGNFATLDFTTFSATSTTATVSVGATTVAIDAVFIDDDSGVTDDIGVDTASVIGANAGDTVSWTGSLVAPFDFNLLIVGTFGPASMSNVADITDISVTIAEAAPAPEPATIALLGLGFLGAGFARRRLSA